MAGPLLAPYGHSTPVSSVGKSGGRQSDGVSPFITHRGLTSVSISPTGRCDDDQSMFTLINQVELLHSATAARLSAGQRVPARIDRNILELFPRPILFVRGKKGRHIWNLRLRLRLRIGSSNACNHPPHLSIFC